MAGIKLTVSSFDVTASATLVRERDPALVVSKPPVIGVSIFRDGGEAKEIDQQRTNTDAAIAEAKMLIAAKLVAEWRDAGLPLDQKPNRRGTVLLGREREVILALGLARPP